MVVDEWQSGHQLWLIDIVGGTGADLSFQRAIADPAFADAIQSITRAAGANDNAVCSLEGAA
jgi:hemolysin-activating ACP:hemolysin acyltransferase